MRNSGMQHIIRVAAGVYVAYLGFKILKNGVVGGEMTGRSWYIGLVFSILFIVIGCGLAVLALRNLNRARELEQEKQEQEEGSVSEEFPKPAPAEKEAEEKPAERSLFDRAKVAAEEEDFS